MTDLNKKHNLQQHGGTALCKVCHRRWTANRSRVCITCLETPLGKLALKVRAAYQKKGITT